jgi:nickel-dependent lactate racemase
VIEIPYGSRSVRLEEASVSNLVATLKPRDIGGVQKPVATMREALMNPVGCPALRDIARAGDTVAIVVNDVTRPTPSRLLVMVLVEELAVAGVPPENITIVVATGTHRASTDRELMETLGDPILRKFTVVNHSAADESALSYIGETKRGLPVWVNSVVAKASLKIVTGTIAPHHFAGYSGGRKSILPGVSGARAIERLHSFPILPREPALGCLEGNAFHEESLAAATLLGVDFVLNVVQNSRHEVVRVVAGDLVQAFELGVSACREMCQVSVPLLADIAIASPGGHPRDINLHQAQKALSVGEMVVKKGGVILLVAECRHGMASDFPRWFEGTTHPSEVTQRLTREGFSVAGCKAWQFARALTDHRVIIVSDVLDSKLLTDMSIEVVHSLEQGLAQAHEWVGQQADTLILPVASEIIPVRCSR